VQQLIIIVEEPMNLFCSLKFPLTRERISSKCIQKFGLAPSKNVGQPWTVDPLMDGPLLYEFQRQRTRAFGSEILALNVSM